MKSKNIFVQHIVCSKYVCIFSLKVTHLVCRSLVVALATADDIISYKTCSLVEITQRPHVQVGVLI